MTRWLSLAAMLCLPGAIGPSWAQSTRAEELATGKLLVASRDLPDPNFAKTVVLLIQYDEDGVLGLILNRRSKVPISQVLDGVNGAKKRPDPIYAGGPVGRTEVTALLRARKAPEDAKKVFGDVFLASSKELLERVFASDVETERVHIYLGYAGWTEPQLENELGLGAWYIFPGSAAVVFDADPDSLWPRLIRETEMRIAKAAIQ